MASSAVSEVVQQMFSILINKLYLITLPERYW